MARDQLTVILTSLFKAVEGAPNAALFYTLANSKDGRANDVYTEENQYIADNMTGAESASERKATLLNPTEEDETVHVLRRTSDSLRRDNSLNEDLALTLGLLFRAPAPMRNRDNMRAVTEGIEAMEGE